MNRSLPPGARGLATIVGFLVVVELASGVLQGYYTPIFSDIADHLGIQDADVNWFEAAQLLVSALCVPPLARLGDLVGHKKVLLLSTAVTAVASWGVAFAPSFETLKFGASTLSVTSPRLSLRERKRCVHECDASFFRFATLLLCAVTTSRIASARKDFGVASAHGCSLA